MQPKAEGRIELQPADDRRGALLDLLRSGERAIRIVSDRLDPDLFDHADIAAELSRIARRARECEVRILVKESHELVKRTHEVGTLYRRLPSSVVIRKLDYSPETQVANYVLVDHHGVLYLPGNDNRSCFVNRDDRALVKYLIEQFDPLWDRCTEDPELRSMPI